MSPRHSPEARVTDSIRLKRRSLMDLLYITLCLKYGAENVRRDEDRYIRIKYPSESGAPTYARIDVRMER